MSKGWVSNTESFIARGAAKSSMTGKPYQVKCGAQAAVPSGTRSEERRVGKEC